MPVYAGIMSGTSCDGIDLSFVRVSGSKSSPRIEVQANRFKRYSRALKSRLLALGPDTPMETLIETERLLTDDTARFFNRTCTDLGIEKCKVHAIGFHGHTVYHQPSRRLTYQLGNAASLFQQTRIPIVSDFRTLDVVFGGEGAPLIPFADALLFQELHKTIVCLNIGGIANISILGRDGSIKARDTGPGNCLLDEIVRRQTAGKRHYDRNGLLARNGETDLRLLRRLERLSLFRNPSLDRGRVVEKAFETIGRKERRFEDILATFTALTARLIISAIREAGKVDRVYISGGGVKNRFLIELIESGMSPVPVLSVRERGIDPDFKESVGFALLAWAYENRIPANIATGCPVPLVLGRETGRENIGTV